jgi:hypothetical protein
MATKAAKAPSNKLGTLVTPVGSALFVSSPRPSQFDANKEEASIILSAEDHAILMAQIDKLMDEYEGELVVPKAKLKYPFKEAVDKEENPTGEMIWKAKTSIQYPCKFYDASGTNFKPDATFQVANRSKIRLAVSVEVIKTSMFQGVVLRLNAIRIISATPWAGNDPFAGYDDGGDFSYDSAAGSDSVADDMDWND